MTDRPLSPAERLLVALSEAVRAAEEAREAARACLAGEIAQRAAVEQLDAVQRERDAALVSASEGVAQRELLRAEADALRADLALAKDLARLAQIETSERTEEARTLRKALANLHEKCGGADAPPDDRDLITATADRVADAIAGAPAEVATLRAALDRRQIEKEDAEKNGDEMEANAAKEEQRAHALAARVIALRAGIVAALAESPAEPADLEDAALLALLRGREIGTVALPVPPPAAPPPAAVPDLVPPPARAARRTVTFD